MERRVRPKQTLAERVGEIIEDSGLEAQFGIHRDLMVEVIEEVDFSAPNSHLKLRRLLRERLPGEETLPLRKDLETLIGNIYSGILGVQNVPGRGTQADKWLGLKGPVRVKR